MLGLNVALANLPPYLRLVAWPALNNIGELPGVTVKMPASLTGQPASLLCSSSEVTVTLPRSGDKAASDLLLASASNGLLAIPVRLVSVLVLWDEVVREQGIFAGNIYLASEDSVAKLLSIAGEPVPTNLGEVLHQIHNLELLYRFPVALKFRGTYGPERQCRANGWGRLLCRLVQGTEPGQSVTEGWRELLSTHVREYWKAYRLGVDLAKNANDDTEPKIWDQILETQPIPVLV
jgi:hypothetical protein